MTFAKKECTLVKGENFDQQALHVKEKHIFWTVFKQFYILNIESIKKLTITNRQTIHQGLKIYVLTVQNVYKCTMGMLTNLQVRALYLFIIALYNIYLSLPKTTNNKSSILLCDFNTESTKKAYYWNNWKYPFTATHTHTHTVLKD